MSQGDAGKFAVTFLLKDISPVEQLIGIEFGTVVSHHLPQFFHILGTMPPGTSKCGPRKELGGQLLASQIPISRI